MRELLTWFGRQSFASRFYLAGGTALALQLGHRRSIGLDFFSEIDEVHDITRNTLIGIFSARGAQILENVDVITHDAGFPDRKESFFMVIFGEITRK